MRSVIATHYSHCSRRIAKRTAGVIKFADNDPKRPSKELRSLDEYFWYTSTDGVARLATSSYTLSEIPRQINDYEFDPAIFAHHECPSTFLAGAAWPPGEAQDLLCAVGSEGEECVGNTCYTGAVCRDPQCRHSKEEWKSATQQWQNHFELRKTIDRGIGVYTKKAFSKEDVLGWYVGEIMAPAGSDADNDYLMEMPIGFVSTSKSVFSSDGDTDCEDLLPTPPASCGSLPAVSVDGDVTVMIDASRKGNWTRFINHSCEPYTEFRIRRVGTMRIMVVEAIRDIPADVELSVSYGPDYYGVNTKKICYCGTAKCVSRFREDGPDIFGEQKKRVKRCSPLTPPLE